MSNHIRVLMVCLGNICRSPTAHGVFEQVVSQNRLGERISVDSAGTSSWHIGSPPDPRSQAAALKRGFDLSAQRGRNATPEDFQHFDYIMAMDAQNLMDLKRIMPSDFKGHLGLFLDYSTQTQYREVPDPYQGGEAGFELVLDLIEDASDGLLKSIQQQL